MLTYNGVRARSADPRARRRPRRSSTSPTRCRSRRPFTGTACACRPRWTACPATRSRRSQPGGSFTTTSSCRDAATFWYHPHVDSAVQVGNGLYGAFIVDDPAEPAGLGDEVVMVLSDIGVERGRRAAAARQRRRSRHAVRPRRRTCCVNGKVQPDAQGARRACASAGASSTRRKSRYFQLALDGHTLHAHRRRRRAAARAPVEVEPPGPDARRARRPAGRRRRASRAPSSRSLDRRSTAASAAPSIRAGRGSVHARDRRRRARGDAAARRPSPARDRAARDRRRDRQSRRSRSTRRATAPFELGINGVPFAKPSRIMAHVGETQVWTVNNTIDLVHPFHLHGFFFQVLDENGAPRHPLEWKDTVNVPVDGSRQVRRPLRRSPGHVDVPLPHPRPRRGRDDGVADGGGASALTHRPRRS